MIKLYIGYHKCNPKEKNIYYLEDIVNLKAFFGYCTIKSLILSYKDENYSIFHRDINYDYIIKKYNTIEELEYDYIEEIIWNWNAIKYIIH